MADAYLSTDISSNGFGDLRIRQVDVNVIESSGYYWHSYPRGVESPPSIINLGGVYSRLPQLDISKLNLIEQGQPWSVVNTQEYLDAINEVRNNAFWLWGSIDTGGFFFYKDQNDIMHPAVCYGWLHFVFNDDELWGYFIGDQRSQGISQTASEQVTIVMTGMQTSGDDNEGLKINVPVFRVLASGLGVPCTYRDIRLIYIEQLLPPTGDYPVENQHVVNNLVEPMSATGGADTLNNDGYSPLRIWLPTTSIPLPAWIQNTIILETQGSWSGGKNIDNGLNPYEEGGTSAPEGGRGEYPTQSDSTRSEDPNSSGVDAIGTGFVQLYNPEKSEIKAFNDYIFSDNITEAISDTLKKLIADPIDYLVFIAMCHFHPNVTLSKEEITFVGIGTGVFSRIIEPQYQVIDCGSISLPEPTASFMDYSPYSKAHIFIPYVGFRELNIEEIMGSRISLKYNIDLLTGSFVAYVEVYRPTRSQFPRDATPAFDTIINQYEGNCYEMLPISSTDFRSTISGMLSVVGGAVSVASGNIGGLGAMASGVMSMKSNVNRSGNATGSYGFIGRQRAFLLLSRPFQSIPSNFGGYEGYPSNIYMQVASCAGTESNGYNDGYLETDENTVWGTDFTYSYNNTEITATDGEINEIQEMFNKGVIVNV